MQGFNSVEYKEITEELEPENKPMMEVKEIIYEGLDGKIKEGFRKIQLRSIPVDKYKKHTENSFLLNVEFTFDNFDIIILSRDYELCSFYVTICIFKRNI